MAARQLRQHQPHGAADRAVGPETRTEQILLVVDADLVTDRPVDGDENGRTASAGRHRMQFELRRAHRGKRSAHHREVLGQAPGHHRIGGGLAGAHCQASRRLAQQHLVAVPRHPRPTWRPPTARSAAPPAARQSSRRRSRPRWPATDRQPQDHCLRSLHVRVLHVRESSGYFVRRLRRGATTRSGASGGGDGPGGSR